MVGYHVLQNMHEFQKYTVAIIILEENKVSLCVYAGNK